MNREIKFRAIYKGIFVYGNLIQGVYDGKPFTQIENTDNNDFQKWEVEPETVGQLTGLKDKNGVDIYEGDILKHATSGMHNPRSNGLVYLKTVSFGLGCFIATSTNPDYFDDPDYVFCCTHNEVIGNIYQTPELLNTDSEATNV